MFWVWTLAPKEEKVIHRYRITNQQVAWAGTWRPPLLTFWSASHKKKCIYIFDLVAYISSCASIENGRNVFKNKSYG